MVAPSKFSFDPKLDKRMIRITRKNHFFYVIENNTLKLIKHTKNNK